jgi:hypothetical protein
MAAHEYAFTLTPGNSSRTRSLALAGAAIAAVCVLSSTIVMRELVGAPTARAAAVPALASVPTPPTPPTIPMAAAAPTAPVTAAAPTARTWTLEPRWWPGEIKQILRPAATTPDSELTFAKGYQMRLAARQGAQQGAPPASPLAQIATGPTAEPQQGRTATAARKAAPIAPADMPSVRRVNAAPVEPAVDPFARFDTGTRALAYDQERPGARGFVYRSAPPPSRGLFGTLY